MARPPVSGGEANPDEEASAALSMAMFFFAAFVLAFRYANFYRNESHWKIAFETWIMTSSS